MRLTYILALTLVATLHASAAAFASAKEPKAVIENGAVPAIVDSTLAEGGRLLRRVDNDYDDRDYDDDDRDYDDDDEDDRDDGVLGDDDEERGFFGTIKKLNPLKAVKNRKQKAAELKALQHAKVQQVLKDGDDYNELIKRSKELLGI